MRLDGKIAIVTGAAGGIGRAGALRFAAEGARVLAADINEAGLTHTAAMNPADSPGSITAHPADLSQTAQVKGLIEAAIERYGRLDTIFSNAAIMLDGSVVDLPEEHWDAMFASNVKAAYLLGKHGIPHMRRRPDGTGGGSFVITASVNAFYAESEIAGYCATKGAVLQLTKAMAVDHTPEGVRVNCICPGWIETAMSQPYLEENPQGRDFAARIAPAGRIGQPSDVAEVALFLASDESSFVTGAAYVVDGGWTAGMTKALALI